MQRDFAAMPFSLLQWVCIIYHSIDTVNIFWSLNYTMLTSLGKYCFNNYSVAESCMTELHGTLLYSVLKQGNFSNTYILQRSVAMRLRCGGIFNNYFTASLPVK